MADVTSGALQGSVPCLVFAILFDVDAAYVRNRFGSQHLSDFPSGPLHTQSYSPAIYLPTEMVCVVVL
jgi:hypothetical protein